MQFVSKISKSPLAIGFTALLSFAVAAPLHSPDSNVKMQDDSVELKVGKATAVELEKGEKKDFRIDLAAGSYMVYLDGKASEHKIDAEMDFLKKNGATISGLSGDTVLLQGEYVGRAGRTITLKANTGLRFRLKNADADDGKFWVTVVPTKQTTFVPFGFGKEVKPASVNSEKGSGGSLNTGEVVYYSAEIPAGQWSYSVGVKSRKSKGTVYCAVEMFDERGISFSPRNIMLLSPQIGEDTREEKIMKVLKPKKVIIRIEADIITGEEFEYDLTIRKDDGQ